MLFDLFPSSLSLLTSPSLLPRKTSLEISRLPLQITDSMLVPSLTSPRPNGPFLLSWLLWLWHVVYSHLKIWSWEAQPRENTQCLSFWVPDLVLVKFLGRPQSRRLYCMRLFVCLFDWLIVWGSFLYIVHAWVCIRSWLLMKRGFFKDVLASF